MILKPQWHSSWSSPSRHTGPLSMSTLSPESYLCFFFVSEKLWLRCPQSVRTWEGCHLNDDLSLAAQPERSPSHLVLITAKSPPLTWHTFPNAAPSALWCQPCPSRGFLARLQRGACRLATTNFHLSFPWSMILTSMTFSWSLKGVQPVLSQGVTPD